MASYNKVVLLGNLTRKPELTKLDSGTFVADLGLAVNEKFKNKAGETVEQVCFVDVIVWGRQAETSAEYLDKGASVLIEGCLKLDQWETKEGEKRQKLRVRAARVVFTGAASKKHVPDESGAPAEYDDDDVPF